MIEDTALTMARERSGALAPATSPGQGLAQAA
jgi:hypothetical protein